MIYSKIKKALSLLVAFVLIFTIAGCSGAKDYDTAELSEKILKLTSFSNLQELSGTSLSSHFVFGDGSVKRFTVRISATGESADTLACFEVKDEVQRSTAVTGISQYLTNLSTFFKSTMEKEYKKVEGRLLVELDDIIVLVICNDTAPVWEYLTSLGAKEVV